MCQKLSKKNGDKCNWSECEKFGKGEFYERKNEVEKLKEAVLQQNYANFSSFSYQHIRSSQKFATFQETP